MQTTLYKSIVTTVFTPHIHNDFHWSPWIYIDKGKWNNKFFKSHSFAEVKNWKIFFQGTNKSILMQEANLSLMCVTVNNSPSAVSPAHSTHRHCFVHLGETMRKEISRWNDESPRLEQLVTRLLRIVTKDTSHWKGEKREEGKDNLIYSGNCLFLQKAFMGTITLC